MFLLSKDYWKIKKTSLKGRGVFALRDIGPGRIVGDYIGKVIKPEDDHEVPGKLYGMTTHDNATILPDPKKIGIHLINHSCMPNCAMYPHKDRILYFTLRKIFSGEELTIDYMMFPPKPDETNFLPYPCYCYSPLCRGTMTISDKKADIWNKYIKQKAGKYFNRVQTPFGKEMQLLSIYPSQVKDDSINDLFGSFAHSSMLSKESKLPPTQKLRATIRKTGRKIVFSKIGIEIYGILNGLLIVKSL